MTQGMHWGDADQLMSPLRCGGLEKDANDESPPVRAGTRTEDQPGKSRVPMSPRLSSGSLAPVPELGGAGGVSGGGGGGAEPNPNCCPLKSHTWRRFILGACTGKHSGQRARKRPAVGCRTHPGTPPAAHAVAPLAHYEAYDASLV
jgi:hypothetical protein